MDCKERNTVGRREKKKMKVSSIDNKDQSKNRSIALSHFQIGNEANKLNDTFENTPTPWGDNDDY